MRTLFTEGMDQDSFPIDVMYPDLCCHFYTGLMSIFSIHYISGTGIRYIVPASTW